MSSSQGPKKILSRTIDEATAPPHDLLITYAASVPTDRLQPLDEWLRADCPTNQYTGPKPTYQMKLDWTDVDECGSVQVVNRAMERCFGARGVPGWEIWIRGDQLNLLVGDFRKMYLKLKALKSSDIGLLEIWVNDLLAELKRIHSLPPAIPSPAYTDDASSLLPKTTDQPRRSSRSPSRALRADEAPYPRVLPMENIGRLPTTFPSKRPSTIPRPPPAGSAVPAPPRAPPISPAVPAQSPVPPSIRSNRSITPRPSTTPLSPTISPALPLPGRSPIPPRMSPAMHPRAPPGGETDNEGDEADCEEAGDREKELEEEDVRIVGESRAYASSDDALDEEDSEVSDSGDEPWVPQALSRRGKTASRAAILSQDSDDEPIWVEPPVSSRKTKSSNSAPQTAKATKTRSGAQTQATSSLGRPTTSSKSTTSQRTVVKRKGPPHNDSRIKKARVDQLARSIPQTPESSSQVPTSSPATGNTTGTGNEGVSEIETPTPSERKAGSQIWLYYIKLSEDNLKNKTCECRGCSKIIKGKSTSNFLNHQRYKCPGLAEAHRRGIPGICCDVPTTGSQATINDKSGNLVQPFSSRTFLAHVMKWIIVSGLPFTTIQNPHLQSAFLVANPDARLQSARSLARRLEDTYDVVNERVMAELRSAKSTIHYTHDSWTDAGRKHSYFGIYATFVDDTFTFRQVLIRLIKMKGKHTGKRMGDGLFDLLHNVIGIAHNIGPGTGDNAANNRTAAFRMQELMRSELDIDSSGHDMVGCMCHIANIAALQYISGEANLTGSAYGYPPENVPNIKVIGETPFWTADLEETPLEDDVVLLDERKESEDIEPHERNTAAMDDSEAVEPDSEDMEEPQTGSSPVDLVHQLGVYVHSSPQRMEEFERVRKVKNPETPVGLLPLKDVVTRWNSKEAAIARVLRLRATVESYTTRASGKHCPRFNQTVFDALRLIQPSLKIFLELTQVYSEVGAHAYRIIPDIINAVDQLQEIHSHPSVSKTRRQSSDKAVKKLEKYLGKFLKNKWVTAAFVLDPTVREEGLAKLLMEEFDAESLFRQTVGFIKDRLEYYMENVEEFRNPQEDEVKWVHEPKRVNKFASNRFQAGQQRIMHDVNDPWECYNSDVKRFDTLENEPPLSYWKRMSKERELKPLALVAIDILGLSASSASVERLFSQAGHVLGRRRGSLSATLLAKQTMLRMWEMEGFLTVDDL